jgi:hypothetical protein
MPPRMVNRTPVGAVVFAWKLWRRLPPETRRRVVVAARSHGVRAARRHGPRVASLIARRAMARRRR